MPRLVTRTVNIAVQWKDLVVLEVLSYAGIIIRSADLRCLFCWLKGCLNLGNLGNDDTW